MASPAVTPDHARTGVLGHWVVDGAVNRLVGVRTTG